MRNENVSAIYNDMNARNHIVLKQIQWAKNHGIDLTGSKGKRGLPAYTSTLEANLFEPLSPETRQAIQRGDGGELSGNPCKMQAVHSSSALGVNIFQYWQNIGQPEIIACASGLCRSTNKTSSAIRFEVKYPVDDRLRTAPNIDVVIDNAPSAKYKVLPLSVNSRRLMGAVYNLV